MTIGSDPEIDRAYDPALAIKDATARLSAIGAAGAAAVAGAKTARLGIRYGETADEYLDIYPAAAPGGPAPLHVFLHGGFWRAFSARDFAFVAPPLQAAGVTAVVVNYALCPAVTIDAIVDQCRRAFAWLWRHAPEVGADPARISLSGHSAGGHLAAMLGATHWEPLGLPAQPIAAIVTVSGLFDIAPLARSWLQPVLRIDDALAARCSPIGLAPVARAPALVIVGAEETAAFYRQSDDYSAMLARADITVERWTLAERNHLTILEEFDFGGALAARLAAIAHDC